MRALTDRGCLGVSRTTFANLLRLGRYARAYFVTFAREGARLPAAAILAWRPSGRGPDAAGIVTNVERVVQDLAAVRWSGADRLQKTEGAHRAG
jgi:hypothetical protein